MTDPLYNHNNDPVFEPESEPQFEPEPEPQFEPESASEPESGEKTTELAGKNAADPGAGDKTLPVARPVEPAADSAPAADPAPGDKTEARPVPAAGAANAPAGRTRLADVRRSAASYLAGRAALTRAFVRRHRVASVALGVLAVAVVGLLALAFAHTGNVPSQDFVAQDAPTRLEAPAYDPGLYGADDILVARQTDVKRVARTPGAIQSTGAQFGASGYAQADVLVSYSGKAVSAQTTATLGYARTNDAWQPTGSPENVQTAWTALAGVDQKKVVANVSALLAQAEADFDNAGASQAARSMTLAQVYDGARVSVEAESFDADAQTDSLTLTLVKASAFEAYTCTLNVVFSFSPASGQWGVSELACSKDAKTRTFDPVLGSWEGTFQSQATDGSKCLAAGDKGLAITISKARSDANTDQLTGTVSGLAHYHDHPADDSRECEGDTVFEDVAFTATLVGGRDDATGSNLAFVATLPEEVGGTVTVTLGFGTADDPQRVTALVKTTYPHTGSFLFIPYEETIVYEDLFVLERVEAQ